MGRKMTVDGERPVTTHDMTLAALSEVNPRAAAALRVMGPNRAGDPMVGLLGFMSGNDCIDLARAADLAHTRAGTDGWERMADRDRAVHIQMFGGWRNPSGKWADRVRDAVTRYQIAIRDEFGDDHGN